MTETKQIPVPEPTEQVDIVAEATRGAEIARRMQAAAEAEIAALSAEEEYLTAEMDQIQQAYESRAERLSQVRASLEHSRSVARMSLDGAESFEDVLKMHEQRG